MLARQVLQEINAGGRVSKKTMLAVDDAAAWRMKCLQASVKSKVESQK